MYVCKGGDAAVGDRGERVPKYAIRETLVTPLDVIRIFFALLIPGAKRMLTILESESTHH